MPVRFWFLPQRVDLRLPAFLDDNSEPRGFDLEELHEEKKVRQRTTAKRIRLPLLHSCSGGVRKSSVHSP